MAKRPRDSAITAKPNIAARGDPGRHMHDGLFRNPPTHEQRTSPDPHDTILWAKATSPGRRYGAPSSTSSSSDCSLSYVTAQSPRQSISNSPSRTFRIPSTISSSPSPIDPSAAETWFRFRRSLFPSPDSMTFLSARSSLSSDSRHSRTDGDTQQPSRTIDPRTFDAAVAILNGHENLVGLETTVDPVDARHRTAWESYEGDNLKNILKSNESRFARISSRLRGLSETLVWDILISLLKAVTYLHTGTRNDDDDSEEHGGWMPIVHNSIDPSNIFLTGAINDQANAHCKLGGFSNCVVLPDSEDYVSRDEDFPIIAVENETGFEAPELVDDTGHPLGPTSDLWSIGAIAIFIMTGSHPWDFLRQTAFHVHVQRRGATGVLNESWRSLPHQRRWRILRSMDKQAEIMMALPGNYSLSLRAFVEALLFIDPVDRGTANDVLQDAMQRSGR